MATKSLFVLVFGLAGCGGLSSYYDSPLSDDTDTAEPVDSESDADADADADADGDADADTEVQAIPIDIDAITPAYGSTAGGTTITITGGPFDASADVFFGSEAAVVNTVNSGTLTVTLPASAAEGLVDVRVVTDEGEGQSADAFDYWADATGNYGTVGAVEWYDTVGTYWSGTPQDFGFSWLYFTEPHTMSFRQLFYAANIDQCASDYAPATGVDEIEVGAAELEFSVPNSASTISMPSDVDYPWFFVDDDITYSQWALNGSYDLLPMTTDGSFPELELEQMARTPYAAIQVISPNISGSTPPNLNKSIPLTWNTSSTADYVLAQFNRYNSSGTLVEVITCAMNDDGAFTVPGATWTAPWVSGQQVNVYVGRVKEDGALLPHNHAQSGAVGISWVVGAGFTL